MAVIRPYLQFKRNATVKVIPDDQDHHRRENRIHGARNPMRRSWARSRLFQIGGKYRDPGDFKKLVPVLPSTPWPSTFPERPPPPTYDIEEDIAANQEAPQNIMETVESLLARFRDRMGTQPSAIRITQQELTDLNIAARLTLRQQPMLVEMEAPINILGDTHGQFFDLMRIFDEIGSPGDMQQYLFVGDFVDRGRYGLETLACLLSLKVKYPERIWLTRGNHECARVNRRYGFWDEMREKYGPGEGETIWLDICHTFNYLPVAALIGKRILCVHGGLSPDLAALDDIRTLPRPQDVPDYGMFTDLLWSDPSPLRGWTENKRGVSFTFGQDIIESICGQLELDMIIRGHERLNRGYKFHGRRLISIFSAPNYNRTRNDGAVIRIDEEYNCSMVIFRPVSQEPVYRGLPDSVDKRKIKKKASFGHRMRNALSRFGIRK